jgi:hypothetical protein
MTESALRRMLTYKKEMDMQCLRTESDNPHVASEEQSSWRKNQRKAARHPEVVTGHRTEHLKRLMNVMVNTCLQLYHRQHMCSARGFLIYTFTYATITSN